MVSANTTAVIGLAVAASLFPVGMAGLRSAVASHETPSCEMEGVVLPGGGREDAASTQCTTTAVFFWLWLLLGTWCRSWDIF